MIQNYLIIAWRNLLRNKFISFINIGGLAIGISTFMLIAIYVSYELSYDDFFKDKERIYRYGELMNYPGGDVKFTNAVGSNRKNTLSQIAGIESIARLSHHPLGSTPSAKVSMYNPGDSTRINFEETGIFIAEQSFVDIFNFDLIYGNPTAVLKDEYAVIISRSTAMRYFNRCTLDLIGKTLFISQTDAKIKEAFTITGVFEDLPANSHFDLDMLLSYTTYSTALPNLYEGSSSQLQFHTYVKIHEDQDPVTLEKQTVLLLDSLIARYYNTSIEEVNNNEDKYIQLKSKFQPLSSIYLSTPGDRELSAHGDKISLFMVSGLGIIVLLISWINFINLTNVQLTAREKEAGLRKVIGANKKSMITQIMLETLNANVIAAMVSFTIITLAIPALSTFLGKHLEVALWYQGIPSAWLFSTLFLLIFFISTAVTGLYSAFVFSGAPTMLLLKKTSAPSRITFSGKEKLRSAFVLVQFSSVYILIAITLGIYLQLDFIQNKELGFNKDQIMVVKTMMNDHYDKRRITQLKQRLKSAGITNLVSSSSNVPGQQVQYYLGLFNLQGDPNWADNLEVTVDEDFIPTMDINIIEGRNFNPGEDIDIDKILINEATLYDLGYKNAQDIIGKEVGTGGNINRKGWSREVIGVFEDIHYISPKELINRMTISKEGRYRRWSKNPAERNEVRFHEVDRAYLSIKLNTENVNQKVTSVAELWKDVFPNYPFDYFFLDAYYDQQYQSDKKFGSVFLAISGISISLACLGFLGMSLFLINRRTKEIGIRKVLGASLKDLFGLMIYRFIVLILIAGIVGIPITYYVLRDLLNEFAYRIDLSWWIFVIPLGIILITAFVMIAGYTIKKVRANPVEALRYE